MQEFKFKIGDLVYTKTAVKEMQHGTSMPIAFRIVERITQECAGGTQLSYILEGTRQGNCRLSEDSLVLCDEVVDTVIECVQKQLNVKGCN